MTAKRAYCSNFALTHKNAFRPHYLEGETLGHGPAIWRNVAEHCLVSGIFVDILAEELGFDAETRDQAVTAALIHDWDKKHESQAINALRNEGQLSPDALDDLKREGDETLAVMGFSPEVIALTASNLIVSADGLSTLSAKILWYVDAMMSNTKPVRLRERFENLLSGWDGTTSSPERAQRNRAFSAMYRGRYGKSLYELQIELGHKIGTELAAAIGYEGDADNLPLYLRQLFVARVKGRDAPGL